MSDQSTVNEQSIVQTPAPAPAPAPANKIWFNSSKNVLILSFILINIAFLISSSVMVKIDNNDGKDCPDVAGPVIAALSYFGVTITLAYFAIVKDNFHISHRISFGILAIICLIIFGGYIPFMSKAQNKSLSDTECLSKINKKMINISELILLGFLSLTSLIVLIV